MELHKAKKLVIVTEVVLLDRIIDMLAALGIHGYTVQNASGAGERGVRASDESGGIFHNVRIDVITNEETAHKVAAQVMDTYFKNYAGIFYLQDVEVMRPKKFQLP